MPIYEYQCEKCGHHLEALQKLSDKPLRECPECGRHRLKRLMSAPRFRLAGSGWYETDFKSDQESKRNLLDQGEKEAPKAEEKGESKTESKAETKAGSTTEAKPAGKAEPVREAKSRTIVTKPSVRHPGRPKAKAAARKPPARRRKR
jgi:putative FmdB family regulatory protein